MCKRVRGDFFANADSHTRFRRWNHDRITYRAYPNEDIYLTGGFGYGDRITGGAIALGQKSYVTVDGFKINVITPVSIFGQMNGADHCIVENCDMRGPVVWGFHMAYYSLEIETQYNIFRNNILIGTDYTEDLFHLASLAHHNIIENNYFEDAGHVVLCSIGSYSPLRQVLFGITY